MATYPQLDVLSSHHDVTQKVLSRSLRSFVRSFGEPYVLGFRGTPASKLTLKRTGAKLTLAYRHSGTAPLDHQLEDLEECRRQLVQSDNQPCQHIFENMSKHSHRRLAVLQAQVCTSLSANTDFCISPLNLQHAGIGAEVTGFSVRDALRMGSQIGCAEVEKLRRALADHGFLVFRHQGDCDKHGTGLSRDELVEFGKWFGKGEIHSSHRVHPRVEHEDAFRVSNNPEEGCFEQGGVGTGGFHSDGHHLLNVYSHAVYQIEQAQEGGQGCTLFADYAKAIAEIESGSPEELRRLRRLHVFNDASGVLHPLVHQHPLTGKEMLLLGGVAGALEVFQGTAENLFASGVPPATLTSLGNEEPKTRDSWKPLKEMRTTSGHLPLVAVRPLQKDEVAETVRGLQHLLSRRDMHYSHSWQTGDLVVTDNLAVAHKAASEAGDLNCGQRILHRVTVAGSHQIEGSLAN